jgi:hypothetical protein
MRSRHALLATLGYLVAALAMTWPLVLGLGRDIPSDLGDPVLNCWILGWDMTHMLRFLAGDLRAFQGFWDANIYHPDPLALAYSEHLVPQALQALPLYALTGRLVLCHNILFLSTFVLSGLGAFLLVRELTGSSRAAFVAGLVYAFAPYRIAQYNHLQVLSSQWMPFAFYGLRRHFATHRLFPLAGAALAVAAQGLSCGYYLLFFTPFAAAYVVFEAMERGILTEARLLRTTGLAAAAVIAMTVPFLRPYLEVRSGGGLLREPWEVEQFSADVWSYVTAPPAQRLWGRLLQVLPRPECTLFPSVVPILLAGTGVVAHARAGWAAGRRLPLAAASLGRVGGALSVALACVALLQVLVIVGLLAGLPMSFPGVSVRSLPRAALILVFATAALLLISPRARALVRGEEGSAVGFWLLSTAAAFTLSLGPTMTTGGRPLGAGPYAFLYDHVPGYDGLRVPARFAMLVALFLAVLAGIGARALERRPRGSRLVVLAGVLFLCEATSIPMERNVPFRDPTYRKLPDRLLAGAETPAIYREVAHLPREAVLAEFPFGSPPWELRYMFYSTSHWRRLVNGFSGGGPRSYNERAAALARPFADGDRAWRALAGSGATHAIVHEWAWRHGKGVKVTEWLEARGARRLAAVDDDVLFSLRVGDER